MHHFDPMSFLIGKVLSAALSAAWKNYIRPFVQGVALCYLVVVFVYFFAATRVFPPRPIGCLVAP